MPKFSSQVVSLKVASSKFLPKKEKALLLLLQGANVTEAAAGAGAHERTVRRWLKDPEFQKRLSEARDDMYTEALDLARAASSKALRRVIKLLDSTSEKIVLKASGMILSFAFKVKMDQESKRRIEEVEKIVGGFEKVVDGIAKGGSYEEFEETRRAIR